MPPPPSAWAAAPSPPWIPPTANEAFSLDGQEETIFYAMPVGKIRPEDQPAEEEFYAFVRKEGL